MAFRCELLSDDCVIVLVRGVAGRDDHEWIIDTFVEGCDAALRLGAPLVLDTRFAHLPGLADAGQVFDELRHMSAEAGVELALRRSDGASSRREPHGSPSPGRRCALGLS